LVCPRAGLVAVAKIQCTPMPVTEPRTSPYQWTNKPHTNKIQVTNCPLNILLVSLLCLK